jgi:hypothetical protein
MNERIKELMVQVCREQGLPFTVEHNRAYMLDNFSEKFAELIVRKCVAICQDVDGEDNIDARSGRQDCAVEIKQHFGVEE